MSEDELIIIKAILARLYIDFKTLNENQQVSTSLDKEWYRKQFQKIQVYMNKDEG